jgi:hypothetical protein
VAYLKTVDDGNKKFILLATDGEPNCGLSTRTGRADINTVDVTGATDAMTTAKAAGFTAYVIGIGPSLANLTKLAQAGSGRDFFPATSPEQLADALSSIGSIVGSCSFEANDVPPDPNNVAVYVNKQQVSRSDSEGWKYGGSEKEIVLTGKYCDQIQGGSDTDVQILFGCPGETYFRPAHDSVIEPARRSFAERRLHARALCADARTILALQSTKEVLIRVGTPQPCGPRSSNPAP